MCRFVVIFLTILVTTNAVPKFDGRIVGGHEVEIENYPHQVSFQYNGIHICGGSIISKNFVITAAHCTDGLDQTQIQFRAESTNRYHGGSLHKAIQIIQHENYNKNSNDYDFSLVKVSPPFNITTAIKIPGIEPNMNLSVDVTGWGTESSGSSTSPDHLMGVSLKIIDERSCNEIYKGSITDRMLCAAAPGKDSCQGDSGGLLIDPKITMLYGIVSWGEGCADQRYPGVYSNIANQREWIRRNAGV